MSVGLVLLGLECMSVVHVFCTSKVRDTVNSFILCKIAYPTSVAV
jgi:hypothetical protein